MVMKIPPILEGFLNILIVASEPCELPFRIIATILLDELYRLFERYPVCEEIYHFSVTYSIESRKIF